MNSIIAGLAGVAVLLISGAILWFCIPHDGKVPRLVESTEIARYFPLPIIGTLVLGIYLIYVAVGG